MVLMIRTTVLLTLLLVLPRPAESALEYDAKAAFLIKVVRFVEWPPRPSTSPVFAVCVFSSPDMIAALTPLESTVVRGRKMQVRDVLRKSEIGGCDVVFFGTSGGPNFLPILESAISNSALTAGNDDQFVGTGGIIALVTAGRRLSIEVNLAAAKKRGFSVSSKLLEVAKVTR
jgi:hypothetical protein